MSATESLNFSTSLTEPIVGSFGITGFILCWASVAMAFAIGEKPEIVKSMVAIVEAFSLGWTFLAVIGFYFGVQLLRK